MLLSLIRHLADNRHKALTRRGLRPHQLAVENLEERSSPANVFWTGDHLPDPTGMASPPTDFDENPLWSAGIFFPPTNWDLGSFGGPMTQPVDNDDLFFTNGLPQVNKNIPLNRPFGNAGPNTGPFPSLPNSINDFTQADLSIVRSVTIDDNGFVIDDFGGNGNRLQVAEAFGTGPLFTTGRSVWSIPLVIPPSNDPNAAPIFDINIVQPGAILDVTGSDFPIGWGFTPFFFTSAAGGIGEVQPNSSVLKLGPGTLGLGGTGTYSGLTRISQGTLDVLTPSALGAITVGTVVEDGATVRAFTVVNAEPLEIQGQGVNNLGALAGFGTWTGPVTLVADSFIGAGSLPRFFGENPLNIGEGTLEITGGISGGPTVTLTKVDPLGTVILNPNPILFPNLNTYQGDTIVNEGTLVVARGTVDAAGARSALGPGFNTTVNNGGTLSLRGNITVSTEVLLTLNGMGVRAEGAFRSIGGDSTDAFWTTPVFLASDTFVGGDLNPSNGISSILTVTGDFSGASDLTKVGENIFVLVNPNPNFTGNTTINGGVIEINHPLALGPTAGGGPIVVNDLGAAGAGTLQFEGTFAAPVTKALTLNGLGFRNRGALRTVGGAATVVEYAGPITLGSTSLIANDPDSRLTISGTIIGVPGAGIQKTGQGMLVLTGSNTYLGPTSLLEGLTIIDDASALGGVGGAGTTVSNNATLQIEGGVTVPSEPLTLVGLGRNGLGALRSISGNNTWGSPINLLSVVGAPAAAVNVEADTLVFNNVLSGGADLIKIGPGTLALTGDTSNSAVGTTFVNTGLLLLNKAEDLIAINGNLVIGDDLGGNNADVVRLAARGQLRTDRNLRVNSSGLLDLNNFNATTAAVTLRGGEIRTGTGTLRLTDNVLVEVTNPPESALITGNLSLGAASRIFNVLDTLTLADDLIVNAVISQDAGAGAGLTKSGAGTMVLGGVNTYTGGTVLTGGTLRLGTDDAIADLSTVNISGGAVFDVNGFTDAIASLTGVAGTTLRLGAGTLTTGGANSSTTFAGTITGSGGLTKVGTGTLTLSGNSPAYTGQTTVNGGTVLVTANQGNAAVVVNAGGTLGGTGTVGPVTVNGGIVTPGLSPGRLTVNGDGVAGTRDVTFDANSTFVTEINGTTAGTQYDQLTVNGSANLGNATLLTSFGFNANVGDSFTLVTTTEGVTGTFKNAQGVTLNDGDTFVANDRVFQIDYTANNVAINMIAFATGVDLTSSANPSMFGNAVTFTATIQQPAGAPAPGGTVTFTVDGNVVALNVPVVANMASVVVPNGMAGNTQFLAGGTHSVVASYSGDLANGYQPSIASLQQQVIAGATTTTLVGVPNPSSFGQDVTFTATVSPSSGTGPTPAGDVVFTDTTTGTVLGTRTLNPSGQATLTTNALSATPSQHSIRADFQGSADYNASSGSFTQTVNAANTSTTVTTSDPDTRFGEPVTFTATVTSPFVTPSGSVTFVDSTTGRNLGTSNLSGTGQAQVVVSDLSVGSHTIAATFNANANFNGSSDTVMQSVIQGLTQTTVQTSASPSVFGQPVTFTATVDPVAPSTLDPTGNVTFVDTLGDMNPANDVVLGTSAVGAMGQAMLTTSTLPVGQYSIRADYTDPAGNYAASSSSILTQVVNPATTTTTITSSADPSVFGQPVTLTAFVDASPSQAVPTGVVSFIVDGQNRGNVPVGPNGRASIVVSDLALGDHTVTATYNSDTPNFVSSTSADFMQTVNAAPTVTTVTSSNNPAGPGQAVTLTAFVNPAPSQAVPTGTVTFLIDGQIRDTVALDGSGRASITVSDLGLGVRNVVAMFASAQPEFLDSTSATFRQVVRKDYFAVGTDAGTLARVNVYDADTGALVTTLLPYGSFGGGVRVAVGDVDGDGFSDIITGSATTFTHVKVFSGRDFSEIRSFLAYGNFTGGVTVAAGDINGDGRADIITGAGAGAPGGHVKAFDGATNALIASFFAYGAGFVGGARVAAGDVNGDGRADIITGTGPQAGVGPHVKVFLNGTPTEIASFFAYGFTFGGGVFVAAGDTNGDGRADIITGAGAVNPHVKVFSGAGLGELQSFFAFGVTAPVGVTVGAVDRNGDGRADLIVGPTSLFSHVRTFDGLTLGALDSFFAFGPVVGPGIFVGGAS